MYKLVISERAVIARVILATCEWSATEGNKIYFFPTELSHNYRWEEKHKPQIGFYFGGNLSQAAVQVMDN